MDQFESMQDVLAFAIKNEEEAAAFYTDMAEKTDNPAMKKVFLGFANEENGHRAKLMNLEKGANLTPINVKVLDLKIADYLAEVNPREELTYDKAIVLAMKREKAAYKLYQNLADRVEDAELQMLFLELAQEEAKHKLRFELEYDEHVMQEN